MTTRIQKIEMAVAHVKRARDLLRQAECKLAADTLAKALKSVEGAERYAKLRASHNDAVRKALSEALTEDTVAAVRVARAEDAHYLIAA